MNTKTGYALAFCGMFLAFIVLMTYTMHQDTLIGNQNQEIFYLQKDRNFYKDRWDTLVYTAYMELGNTIFIDSHGRLTTGWHGNKLDTLKPTRNTGPGPSYHGKVYYGDAGIIRDHPSPKKFSPNIRNTYAYDTNPPHVYITLGDTTYDTWKGGRNDGKWLFEEQVMQEITVENGIKAWVYHRDTVREDELPMIIKDGKEVGLDYHYLYKKWGIHEWGKDSTAQKKQH